MTQSKRMMKALEQRRMTSDAWLLHTETRLTKEEAERAIGELYRFALDMTWTGVLKLTRRQGHANWHDTSWRSGSTGMAFTVNLTHGWPPLVHMVAEHCAYMRHRHMLDGRWDSSHALDALEWRMVRHVLNRKWLDGRLRDKKELPTKPRKIAPKRKKETKPRRMQAP